MELYISMMCIKKVIYCKIFLVWNIYDKYMMYVSGLNKLKTIDKLVLFFFSSNRFISIQVWCRRFTAQSMFNLQIGKGTIILI